MIIDEYNMHSHLNNYKEWRKINKEIFSHQPLCDEDLCIGYGITLDAKDTNFEILNRIIGDHNDYVWVREYGLLHCLHYTSATEKKLIQQGLTGSHPHCNNNLTFANGIYVYNTNQQYFYNEDKSYVTFYYCGEYYKCVYDCDPQAHSKDLGCTQEYLLPTMNIPYEYLDTHGVK